MKWLVLFCCALLLCSCNTSSPDTSDTDTQQESSQDAPDVLDEDTQQKIRQDYARLRTSDSETITADDVTIERYLGTYQDGSVALFLTAKEVYFEAIVEEDIAGIHFTFPNSQPLFIYYHSEFTPLKQAFERGLITKSDVEKIYDSFMSKDAQKPTS